MGKKVVLQRITWKGWVMTTEYPTIGKSLVTDVSKHAQAVRDAAMRHGYKQGSGDSKSGATPLEKYEMNKRRHAAWEAGSWTLQDREVSYELVIEAIARVMKETGDKVATDLKEKYKTPEAIVARLKELRQRDDVRLEILEIQRERAAEAVEESEDEDLVL